MEEEFRPTDEHLDFYIALNADDDAQKYIKEVKEDIARHGVERTAEIMSHITHLPMDNSRVCIETVHYMF